MERFRHLRAWQPVCLLYSRCPRQDFEHGPAKFSEARRGRNGNRFDQIFNQIEVCDGCRPNSLARREYQAQRIDPFRTLRRTGEKVSIVGIGGHHIGRAMVSETTKDITRQTSRDGLSDV